MKIDELTRRRVEAALLARDGSCRDINFSESILTSRAIEVLQFLASSWTYVRGMTGGSDEIASAELEGNLQLASGSLSIIWNGGRNPEHIQAYFYWNESDKVFCEITFFPQDIDSGTFKLIEFLSMLGKLVSVAGSDEYYLGSEDANWRHGQQKDDAVILSDKVLLLSLA